MTTVSGAGPAPDQAAMHGTGWGHFLDRLSATVAGADPGPDPWDQG